MKTKKKSKRRRLNLTRLERIVFSDHVFSISKLREFAYAKKCGESLSPELMAHIENCKYCQRELELLKQSDPILNGEDDKRSKVLIDTI